LRGTAADGGGQLQVGVVENDERVRAAELEDAPLEHLAGRLGNLRAGSVGTGERDRGNTRIGDQPRDGGGADQQRGGDAGGDARAHEQLLDGERAARHVGGVLQDHGVAAHQGRRRRPEELPVGEVPGHHGQDDAQRLVLDVTLGRVGWHLHRRQQLGAVLRVPIDAPRALLDLGSGLHQRLAHLLGGEGGEARLLLAEELRDLRQARTP